MAATSGKSGSFKIGATAVANLKNWKLDINQDLKEVTSFGSNGWKEQQPTIKSFSGSVDGDWNMADTTGQKAMQDSISILEISIGLFRFDSSRRCGGIEPIHRL
jgi:predicted secreted protein